MAKEEAIKQEFDPRNLLEDKKMLSCPHCGSRQLSVELIKGGVLNFDKNEPNCIKVLKVTETFKYKVVKCVSCKKSIDKPTEDKKCKVCGEYKTLTANDMCDTCDKHNALKQKLSGLSQEELIQYIIDNNVTPALKDNVASASETKQETAKEEPAESKTETPSVETKEEPVQDTEEVKESNEVVTDMPDIIDDVNLDSPF